MERTFRATDNETGKTIKFKWLLDADPTQGDIQEIFTEANRQRIVSSITERTEAEAKRQKALSSIKPVIGQIKEEVGAGVRQIVRRPLEIWKEEATSGLNTFGEALKERSLLSGVGGLVQYTFSPLFGYARGWGGDPVREVTKMIGAPSGVQEFAGAMTEEALMFLDPIYVAKEARQIPKAAKLFGELRKKKIGQLPELIPKSKTLKKILGELPEEPLKEFPLVQANARRQFIREGLESGKFQYVRPGEKIGQFTQRLDIDVQRKITDAFAAAGEGNFEEGRRIFKQVRDALALGEIQIEELPNILRKHKLTSEQFAQLYSHDVSDAARVLSYHSAAIRRLRRAFSGESKALHILEDAITRKEKYMEGFGDKLFEWWARLDRPRRAIMVSQLATAMRNMWSQAGRITMGTFDDALQTYLKTGSSKAGMKEATNTFWSVMNQVSPQKRKLLREILDSESAGLQAARLISQPVHEVTAGSKIGHFVMTLNRIQEHFFRKLAFEAKLRSLLNHRGLPSPEKIKPNKIPQDVLKEAVEYGLEMTFAKSAQTRWQKSLVDLGRIPGFTTIQPYPRFAYANALPFLLDHTPLGYLKAFSPKTLEELASGNPARFAKAASRATIGTLMFSSAWQLRQSEYAGERWYQIKLPGKFDKKTGEQLYIDTRAYAPFSTYLFMAELFCHPERLKATDFAQAIIGLNRIAGSGLVLVDLLRAKTPETAKEFFINFLGQYVGSFGVTARMFKDIGAGIAEISGPEGIVVSEDSIIRNTRINPEIAPLLDNIPKASRLLTEASSPLKASRLRRLHPLLRQTTGLTITSKNKIQAEVDKLGMDYSYIYPRWGDAKVNAKGAEYMGPIVEMYADKILENENYQKLDPLRKQIVLHAFFQLARQEARWQFQQREPEMASFARLEGSLNLLQKKLIEQVLGKSLNQVKRDFRKKPK